MPAAALLPEAKVLGIKRHRRLIGIFHLKRHILAKVCLDKFWFPPKVTLCDQITGLVSASLNWSNISGIIHFLIFCLFEYKCYSQAGLKQYYYSPITKSPLKEERMN